MRKSALEKTSTNVWIVSAYNESDSDAKRNLDLLLALCLPIMARHRWDAWPMFLRFMSSVGRMETRAEWFKKGYRVHKFKLEISKENP